MVTEILLLVVALAVDPPAETVAAQMQSLAQSGLQVQAIQVPHGKLLEQLRKYLPGTGVTRTVTLDEFRSKVERWKASSIEKRHVLAARLAAKIDLVQGRLVGEGEWQLSPEMAASMVLHPWNLAVHSIQRADQADAIPFGMDAAGSLVLDRSSKDLQRVSIRWSIPAERKDRELLFELQIPPSTIAYLDLLIPSEGKIVPLGRAVELPSAIRLFFDSQGRLSFRVHQEAPAVSPETTIAERVATRVDVQSGDISLAMDINVRIPDGVHDPITIEVANSLSGATLTSTVPGQWRRMANEDSIRWSFVPRDIGLHAVAFSLAGKMPYVAGSRWSSPRVHVEGALTDERTLEISLAPSLRWTGLGGSHYRLESASTSNGGGYRLVFHEGVAGDGSAQKNRSADENADSKAPLWLSFENRAQQSAQVRHQLDLRGDRPFLSVDASITWNKSALSQQRLVLPKGWRLFSVQTPQGEPRLESRTQLNADGSTEVWLDMASAPSGPTPWSLTLEAEYFGDSNQTVEQTFVIPEVQFRDIEVDQPATYEVLLPPDLPAILKGVPRSTNDSSRPADSYVFTYYAPLADASVSLRPSETRWSVTSLQETHWRGSEWVLSAELDIDVTEGSKAAIHLISSHPLPESLDWQIVGEENAVVRWTRQEGVDPASRVEPMVDLPPEEQDQPQSYHYLIETAFPLTGRCRLETRWIDSKTSIEIPVLEAPDANRFRGRLEIASRTGRIVHVKAKGFSAAAVEAPTNSRREDFLVWSSGYEHISPDTSLSVEVDERIGPTPPKGQAFVVSRTRIEAPMLIHEVRLWLYSSVPSPLILPIHSDSTLWVATLDGETVAPALDGDKLQLSSNLTAGAHQCRIVYSTPLATQWAISQVRAPAAPIGWKSSCHLWTVEHRGFGHLIADRNLINRSSLRRLDRRDDRSPIILLDQGEETVQAARLIQSTYPSSGTLLADRKILDRVMEAVPASWQIAIDREIHSSLSLDADEPTLADWLQARGLLVIIGAKAVLVTRRVPEKARIPLTVDWSLSSWTTALTDEVARQGVDTTGEFVAPNLISELTGADAHAGLYVRKGDDSAPTYAETFLIDPTAPDAMVSLIPGRLLNRISRMLALTGIVVILLLGRKWSLPTYRAALVVLLAMALVTAVGGGLPQELLTLGIWCTTATVVLLVLTRTWPKRPLAAAGLAACLVSTSAVANTGPRFRILIPAEEDGSISRVIIPDALNRLLDVPNIEQGEPRLILESAEYQGHLLSPSASRWTAQFDGWIPAHPKATSFSLALAEVDVSALHVDTKPVEFREAGGPGGIEFSIPPDDSADENARREVSLQITFDCPILEERGQKTLKWQTPRAARNRWRLRIEDQIPFSLPEGNPWSIRSDNGAKLIEREGGPVQEVSLNWLTVPAHSSDSQPTSVESAVLVDMSVQRIAVSAAYQSENLAPHRLTFDLASELRIDGIRGPRLKTWSIATQSAEARRLEIDLLAAVEPTSIVVTGALRPGKDGVFTAPPLSVLGTDHRSVLGLSTSEAWQVDVAAREKTEPIPATLFAGAWAKLHGGPEPGTLTLAERLLHGDDSTPRLRFSWKEKALPWSVTQIIDAELRPSLGIADLDIQATIQLPARELPSIEFRVPAGMSISKITGDQLAQWFQQDDRIVLLSQNGWSGRPVLHVRGIHKCSKPQEASATRFDVTPLLWADDARDSTDWTFHWPASWEVALRAPSEQKEAVDRTMKTSSVGRAPIGIDCRIVQPQILADCITVVTPRDGETTFEGKFDIESSAAIERLEFRTPAGLMNMDWDAQSLPAPTSQVRGEERIWTFDVVGSANRRIEVAWKTSSLSDTGRVTVPRVQLTGKNRGREWILVRSGQRAVSESTRGLKVAELPESLLAGPLGPLTTTSDQPAVVYQSTDDLWQLALKITPSTRTSTPFRVIDAQLDLEELADGSVSAVTTFQMIDQGDGVFPIELPASATVDRVEVDGFLLTSPRIDETSLRVPIYQRSSPQNIAVYWRAPVHANVLAMPTVRTNETFPVLIRTMHPQSSQWALEAQQLDRMTWLTEMLRRNVAALSRRVERGGTPQSDGALAGCLADAIQCRDELAVALSAAAHRHLTDQGQWELQPHALSAQFEELNRQLTAFASQVSPAIFSQAATPASSSELRTGLPFTAERISYFLAPAHPESIRRVVSPAWSQRPLTTNEGVRIAAAALSLLLVAVRPWWRAMRIYWPAYMLAIGLAWSQFADSYGVGWILIALAVAGAVWSVNRWFDGNLFDSLWSLLRQRVAPKPIFEETT